VVETRLRKLVGICLFGLGFMPLPGGFCTTPIRLFAPGRTWESPSISASADKSDLLCSA
jgi:hypothetical protein